MNDTNNGRKDENTGRMKSTGTSSPKDVQQISRIITALNMIKMNLGMYPDGHASVDQSVELAYTLLQNYLQGRAEINIGVTGKTLMLNENELDKNNSTYREYAHALSVFHVIFLGLKRTVTRKDLLQFSKILCAKTSDIRNMDKLENILTRSSIKGIEVKTIDAGYFQLTEEKNTRNKTSADDFWREFLPRMARNASRTELRNSDGGKSDDVDLTRTIRTLNDNRQHWQKAVASYENIIENYFSDIQTDRPVSAEKYESLAKITNLIDNFHPDLKEQLMDVAGRQLTRQPETALTMESLKYFPNDMLPVIIRLASERKRQISPALIKLLDKLSAIEKGGNAQPQVPGQTITSSEMGKLLKREEYEEYIPGKYDQLLKKMSGESSTADNLDQDGFPLSEYLKTLDDEYIDFSIGKMLLALMEEETDEENYLAYSARLALFIPELLKNGEFSFLISVIETFRRHEQQNTPEKIRRQALSVLSILADPSTIARNTTPFILKGGDTTEITKFLVMNGAQNISWLFDLYLDPAATAPEALIDIIKEFGNNAVDEAAKRMENQTPLKALRILALMRNIGNQSTIPLLKKLYEYDDDNVKKEVIEIFFLFKDSGAIDLLRKSLHSSNREEVLQAVSLTFLYEVKELMGELMSLLKTFYIREEDAILNEWIVRRLGGTGKPWAAPYMETITAIRLTLSPQRLSRMKEILYEALEYFPRPAVQELLKRGSKSWNKRIRESCLKIMGQKGS
jgi:hypothetical protein